MFVYLFYAKKLQKALYTTINLFCCKTDTFIFFTYILYLNQQQKLV